MGLFDLFIFATLLVNAAAIFDPTTCCKQKPASNDDSIRGRFFSLVNAVRVFRTLIMIWNLFVMLTLLI